jgi:environmental stress-induced protein Ves
MIRIQRAAGRAPAPWKNGGGVTCEVAAWPPGTGSGEFDWRISIASVTRGGPFSAFPGVDRALAVLTGTLRLAIEGREEILLQPGSPSVHFPGDVPCHGEPQDAAVTDLNVMTRRGKLSSRLAWITVDRQHTITANAHRTFVLVLDPLTLISRGLAYQLHAQDLAELQPEDGEVGLVAHTAHCIFIELSAA